jgi:hypothetical protein
MAIAALKPPQEPKAKKQASNATEKRKGQGTLFSVPTGKR